MDKSEFSDNPVLDKSDVKWQLILPIPQVYTNGNRGSQNGNSYEREQGTTNESSVSLFMFDIGHPAAGRGIRKKILDDQKVAGGPRLRRINLEITASQYLL